MKDNRRTRWVIALAVLGVSTAAIAEEVMVKYQTAVVRTGMSAGNQTVAVLKNGDKLQVLKKEGSWLKVKAGDKEGYVQANYVTAAGKNSGGNPFGALSALASGSSGSSEATDSAAVKGVEPDSLKWARSNGKSTAGLDRMTALSESLLKDGDLPSFQKQGNVGTARK